MTTHDAPAWYSRLTRAARDVQLAGTFAAFALEWEQPPDVDEAWEMDDHNAFMRRAAYTLAFLVTYARPFALAKGWPKIDAEALPYNDDERQLHAHILRLRNEFWAHTDAQHYKATPIISADHPPDSLAHVMEEPLDVTDDELRAALVMISKAAAHFNDAALPFRRELVAHGVALDVDKL
jgi:hypothetical protein